MRALVASLTCLLCVACAAPAAVTGDGWGVQPLHQRGKPALSSFSDINLSSPVAQVALAPLPVRTRTSDRWQVVLAADQPIAPTWRMGAALLDPELDRALAWLAALGAEERRGIQLNLTLVADQGARRRAVTHPADATLIIDLLVPVPAKPTSRSGTLDAALAVGLHEVAHALAPERMGRDEDERRASLVAACYRIDAAQRGDRIQFGEATAPRVDEFTRAHSASAANAVRAELAGLLGTARLAGEDRSSVERLRAYCRQRLAIRPH